LKDRVERSRGVASLSGGPVSGTDIVAGATWSHTVRPDGTNRNHEGKPASGTGPTRPGRP
jgi:hypothetical protein